MQKPHWIILATFTAMLAASALLLQRMSDGQRLGEPGLKVVNIPLTNPGGKIIVTNSVYLPEKVGELTSELLPVTQLEYDWLPKDTTYGRRLYQAPDKWQSMISIVLMGRDRTSIHKPQYCLAGQGWQIIHTEEVKVRMNNPHPYDLPVMKLTTSKRVTLADGREVEGRGYYVYWFVSNDQLTARHGQRMWWMARDLVQQGVLKRWGYIAYFTTFAPGQETAALHRLKTFIADSAPDIQIPAGAPITRTSALEAEILHAAK